MEIFCAVDIRGGRCVRLRQGDYHIETVYSEDPVAVASKMASEGAHWIHVVDLDGARTGQPENAATIAEIVSSVQVPVQTGGGIRTEASAKAWFDMGVERVVLGTAAMRDAELVATLAKSHRVAVGLDARAGEIATDGWLRASGRSVLETVRRFVDIGVDALIVTDIARDGMLSGPDLAGMTEVLNATCGTGVDIIASGGVASLQDLQDLASLNTRHVCTSGVHKSGGVSVGEVAAEHGDYLARHLGVHTLSGVIVGKALYEKRFTVAEAVAVLSGQSQTELGLHMEIGSQTEL